MFEGQYIGMLMSGEQQLAESYFVVAERHQRDYQVHAMCKEFASWCSGHVQNLEPFAQKYGRAPAPAPEGLRGSLFHGSRAGTLGMLYDLQDLSVLANSVRTNWTILDQAAMGNHDKELEAVCKRMGHQIDRQLAWLCTTIKNISPEAVIVPPNLDDEARASVPKKLSIAAFPDQLWSPLAGGALVLVTGLISLVAGQVWLFPSLGPTAYLQAESPAHPNAKLYNTVVGHLVGLLAGFLSVFLFNAYNDPVVLVDKKLTLARVAAATLGVALTLLVALLLRASHPPAAATTLLVALGSIKTTQDALNLAIGVVIIGLLGEALRRARLGKQARMVIEPRIPVDHGMP